ncbi:MAG: response regulator [Deltaproteobacteria bacterium]|nr:response regulator [Deltaproteobacteria bacterium]
MAEERTTILVADDDDEIRKVLSLVLEKAGYRAAAAAHGQQALEMMGSEQPALVLLDIMMPHMDGLEVIRRMRADDKLRAIPVIAFTALTSQLIEKELFDLGVRGFMRKPLHLTDMLEMVGMELKRLALERQNSSG